MIDPRFAAAGAAPIVPGFGAQQIPNYHHHHRHRHHRKNKHGTNGGSPVSRDESIHKVDHSHHQFQQHDNVPYNSGYNVPYNVGGYYGQPQAPQFVGGSYGFTTQYQGDVYNQGQYVPGVEVPTGRRHRRHHRSHRQHAAEASNAAATSDQVPPGGAPEHLVSQRSSSVVHNEVTHEQSPQPVVEGELKADQGTRQHRHRHRRHHHSTEPRSFSQNQRANGSHTQVGSDGYGHINEDLIFIERGEHSPHRQDPPSGYEYKGKIEVQSVDREYHTRTQVQGSAAASFPVNYPMPQAVPPVAPTGTCPPGWQQVVLSATPGAPYASGAGMYTGQVVGATTLPQPGLGGIGGFGAAAGGIGFGGVGPAGAAGTGGGLANLAASLPFPPQGQLVADYFVDSNSGGASSSAANCFVVEGQQTSVTSTGQAVTEQVAGPVSTRATIIEVWQKRSRSEGGEKARSRSRSRSRSHSRSHSRGHKAGPSVDFDRFRHEILSAIERIVQNAGPGSKIHWTGHDGGTQTQINQSTGYDDKREGRTVARGGDGEVRVIVQPIQPVFYMPKQGETASGTHIGPAPAIQQTSGGAQVVYVPRNVYVPVIKPVFVPRERVIVRPQVIHVARPVLVDRPVPVTQRPIIIDRERPIPVPVRGASQGAAEGVSKTVREEYVYRDNLPVAYGGRCAEFAGGVNYGYMPTQQDHQYAASSVQEISGDYLSQGPVVNVTAPEQYQHTQSVSQVNLQEGPSSFHGSYTNLAQTSNASAMNVTSLACSGPIEILDPTVNPNWQRTDKSSLVSRYGRTAYDIVQKTDEVEQQMYQELRQRNSSGGIQRSSSVASYGSGSGIAVGGGGGNITGAYMASGGSYMTNSGSFSSMPVGDIQNINSDGTAAQGSATLPVCINY